MAEQEFYAAAVFAFLGWMVACALAAIRSGSLTSGSAKTVCWIIPVTNPFVLIYLIYEGLYADGGGFRYIALGLVSVVFWVLAVAVPVAQLLFGYFARVVDRGNQSDR